jgi:hypothetical protein
MTMPNNRYTASNFKRFRREMFDLAVSLRDAAPEAVKRIYPRKARAYLPYIGANALSRARKKDGTGGPFGALPAWLAPLTPDELAAARAHVDAVFDRIEAEKCAAPLCLHSAMRAQQEADSAEDVEETAAHLSGDYRAWVVAVERQIAAARVAVVAAAKHEHGRRA